MRVITCNTRDSAARKDGDNHWTHRHAFVAQVLRAREPDLIGFQEVREDQFRDLRAAFPEYEWTGLTDRPEGRDPFDAIFYRADAFDRIASGGYWLSQTPHVPGTKSWDSSCVRQANWVRLVLRATGVEFRLVNTHLDHVGQTAREQQARLLCEDAAAYPPDYPQILTGDMNCAETNPAMGCFWGSGWRDTHEAVHGVRETGFTFHGFLGEQYLEKGGRIDWILTRGRVRATDAQVIRDQRDGRFPSDHYFVSADIELA